MIRSRCHRVAPALLLLLAACGGGGGGGGATPTPVDAPSNLTYPRTVAVLLSGAAASGLTASVTGTVTAWSIAPTLPPGLSLNSSGAIVGIATAPSAETTYVVTASNGSGSTQFSLSLRVAPAPQLLLTSGSGENAISTYTLDAATGKPRPHGWTPTAGSGPDDVLAHPTRGVAYLVQEGTDVLQVLRLQPSSGDPDLLQSLPLGAGEHSLALHPGGNALYATSSLSDSVRGFAIAPDGTLTAQGPAVITGDDPGPLAVAANGGFLYVGNRGNANLAILPLDGALAPLAPSATFALAGSVPGSLSGVGRRLYLTPSNFDFVVGLDSDPATGALSVINSAGTPFAPTGLAVQPGGRSLLVVYGPDKRLQRFPLTTNGTLGTPGTPLDLGTDLAEATFDASGLFAYVAAPNLEATFAFRADAATGTLTSAGAVRTRGPVRELAVASGLAPLRARVRGLYAVDRVGGELFHFSSSTSNGMLTAVGGGVPLGSDPVAVAADPFGKFLFAVCTQNRLLWTVPLDASGNVGTPPAPITNPPQDPVSVAVDPSGRTVYVGSSFNGVVASYRVNRTTGVLTPLSQVTVGGNPSALRVDPTGQYLVVADPGSGQLKTVALNDGSLVGSTLAHSAPGGPGSIEFDLDGAAFYSAMRFSNQVQAFRLNVGNGTLLAVSPAADAGVGSEPRDVVVHPGGTFVLAALAGLGDVRRFTVQSAGVVQPANSDSAGLLPVDLELSPKGSFLYWVDPQAGEVGLHQVSSSGGLTFGGTVPAGDQPTDCALAVTYE